MEVAASTIRTPFDYPHSYQVDWRHEIALHVDELREEGIPCPADDIIRRQSKYLKDIDDPIVGSRLELVTFSRRAKTSWKAHLHHANTIYQSSGQEGLEVLKDRLEALLLCAELSYEQIGKFLNIEEAVVRIYERLFYHVRDDEGCTLVSPWLREYFATQGATITSEEGNHGAYWKLVAVQGGFKVLYQMWGWTPDSVGDDDEFPEKEAAMMMMRQLLRSMDQRVRFNNLDPRSLVQFYDVFQNSLQDMRERGLIASEAVATEDDVTMHFLNLLQPKMRELDESAMLAKQDELKAKIKTIKEMERKSGEETSGTVSRIGAQLGQ